MRTAWELSTRIPLILIAILSIAILAIIIVHSFGWVALLAVGFFFVGAGMLCTLLWDVYLHTETTEKHPKLEFIPFEQEPPYLRQEPEIDPILGRQVGFAYYVDIPLMNTGETTARNCRCFVTAMGWTSKGQWYRDRNWVSKALKMNFGSGEERILVPKRSNTFRLGRVSTSQPERFLLSLVSTTHPASSFGPGRYCFEVKVVAENAEPSTKYFHVYWDGGCTESFEEFRKYKIRVFPEDHPPWATEQV